MPIPPRQFGHLAPRVQPINDGWELAVLAPGIAADPEALAAAGPDWRRARVPGTAMAALNAAGLAEWPHLPDLDARDVWYRCRLPGLEADGAGHCTLRLEGLATLAEVWFNGRRVLASGNMFVTHDVELDTGSGAANDLLIRFASATEALKMRRPRPRWRTRLVEQQQLRWLRTTLLGRIPGWAGVAPAIGPWRPVSLQWYRGFRWDGGDVAAELAGTTGIVRASLRLRREAGSPAVAAAHLRAGEHVCSLQVLQHDDGDCLELAGELRIPAVRPWWPHTHGDPVLYPVSVVVETAAGMLTLDFGRTGFRHIELVHDGGSFAIKVNGTATFCRGACWTSADALNLTSDEEAARQTLLLARQAGMNMLRVGGTMFYEADHFYALCDELGILIWHDWMFASMDYPSEDAGFIASVTEEATQFLQRIRLSPCLALLCGNSEVEQQAAMLGMEQPLWRNRLFAEILPQIGTRLRPDVPYWPSSPAGGALPFQVDSGAAHYFGVGAYLQPLTDARRCGLKFASECLALANVPEPPTLDALARGGQAPVHHPAWKAGVPRDSDCIGWDFDDVRDHYLAELFKLEPARLRYADVDRYLRLSRVVSGEVMAAAFREWRRHGSACNGALVWYLRDLWPGAGWGLLDATGLPKAPWYYLQRALAPIALLITDEGLNGLALHGINDTAQPLSAEVTLILYRHGQQVVAEATQDVAIPARGSVRLDAAGMLGRFVDITQVYRFGPPGHNLVFAALRDAASGNILGTDFFFPLGHDFPVEPTLGLEVSTEALDEGRYRVTVRTRKFAQAVAIDAPGYSASHNYFHLQPGGEQQLQLISRGRGSHARLDARLQALNSIEHLRLAPQSARAAV